MSLNPQRDNPTLIIPISVALERCDGAVMRGMSREALLRASFVDPEHETLISFAQLGLLYINMMVEMGDQFIGLGRRVVPTSRLALLFRVMMGCGTLDGALNSLVQFHDSSQPISVQVKTGELAADLCVNCADSFAGANAPLIEDIYILSIFGGLSYFLGRAFPATLLSTRNHNNPVIGSRHYSMSAPLQLGTVAAIRFPTSLLVERRQAEPTDDIYWSVFENWLAIANASGAPASDNCFSIKQLNTKSLCAELGISAATFRRRNSIEGSNFRHFREETLVKASLRLLADASRSISSIAGELGYADVRSYRRFIKGATGHTPDQLRASSVAATMRAFEPNVVARIKELTTRLSR